MTMPMKGISEDQTNTNIDIEGAIIAKKHYVYEVLPASDEELLIEVAECLAKTFSGVKSGNAFIVEPVVLLLKISYETMKEFIFDFLKQTVNQGLTIIAREKCTGKVIGAVAAESFQTIELNPPLLKGDFAPFNKINQITRYLVKKYEQYIYNKLGRKIVKEKHIRIFLTGVMLEKNKKYIAAEMRHLLEEICKNRGYQYIFSTAPNHRSQKMNVRLNYHMPLDCKGVPIAYSYAKDPVLKYLPNELGEDCKLFYKELT
ncbi:hypothetical protein [Metabacillus niabensis]|uniref:Uncharacterized protein n=1 Tax=Metabacillus niabensis TaxID=324854 RepID=A0ABT9Z0L2_9BACI|nr:hypothetical protein [Metabacillus niabensis]MDQ0225737.1 hypothetical protein [Metabacillus niabensis]